MNVLSRTHTLRALREQPLWRLLAGDKAPAVLALLQGLLLDGETVLPASVALERLVHEVDVLRAAGDRAAADAAAVPGRLAGAGLADAAAAGRRGRGDRRAVGRRGGGAALRRRPGQAAQQRHRGPARRGDEPARCGSPRPPTPTRRAGSRALLAERDRLDDEIARVEAGAVQTLPEDRALERVREIIALADELARRLPPRARRLRAAEPADCAQSLVDARRRAAATCSRRCSPAST